MSNVTPALTRCRGSSQGTPSSSRLDGPQYLPGLPWIPTLLATHPVQGALPQQGIMCANAASHAAVTRRMGLTTALFRLPSCILGSFACFLPFSHRGTCDDTLNLSRNSNVPGVWRNKLGISCLGCYVFEAPSNRMRKKTLR